MIQEKLDYSEGGFEVSIQHRHHVAGIVMLLHWQSLDHFDNLLSVAIEPGGFDGNEGRYDFFERLTVALHVPMTRYSRTMFLFAAVWVPK